jgi:rod shape-determining protein MreD
MMYDVQELLRHPIRLRAVVVSLFIALLLNLLPWHALVLPLAPDFLALMLLFWCIYQPRRVGLGLAFVLGLFMDVAEGNLLGQHALAYTFAVFVASLLRRRIQSFDSFRQAAHVLVVLLLMQGVLLLLRLASGPVHVNPAYFLASLIGAILWPVLLHVAYRSIRKKTEF